MGFVVDICTGATQGIGRAVAESIAHHRAMEIASASGDVNAKYALFLVGRNTERGTKAARDIQSKESGGLFSVYFEPCDLSNYDGVLDLKDRVSRRLGGCDNDGDYSRSQQYQVGILVNDAAECPVQQEFVIRQKRDQDGKITSEHVDKQFASNVLGYHFMIKAFQPHFSSDIRLAGDIAKTTHICNIASNWAGDLDLDDLHFKRRSYDNDSAYRQSKQCDRMLTKIWSEKLVDSAIVNSCHPGDPCTKLSKDLGYNLWASKPTRSFVEDESPIRHLCGFGSHPLNTTGGWFDGGGRSPRPMRCRFALMTIDILRLYDICDSFAIPKSTSE